MQSDPITSQCPVSVDAGLLLLRLWLGLSMFLIHGLGKATTFGSTVGAFRDKGIPLPFAIAAILAESVCALLLALGLFSRLAALFLAITMAVAFILVHHAILTFGKPTSGELAFIYLAGYLTILLTGPGRFAIDKRISPESTTIFRATKLQTEMSGCAGCPSPAKKVFESKLVSWRGRNH